MAAITVDDTIIHTTEAADYFASPGTDRRIKTGFRLALEWLGIPIPDYARRGDAYRPPAGRAVAATYANHNGLHIAKTYRPLTAAEVNHRVACAVAKDARRHSTTSI